MAGPETPSFRVYDFPFRVRTNVDEAQHLMTGLYRDFLAPALNGSMVEASLEGDTEFSWRLGDKAASSSTLPGALWGLEAALCEAIIRSQRRSIAIHAATLRAGNSVALLAASSQTGKTTLSLALVRRGLMVAGDDVTLVDPETLNVLPIPRCFHLDDRGAALVEADGLQMPAAWKRSRFIVPNDFGKWPQAPSCLRWLIFMRGPRAGHPRITAVSQAEMTARLLSETGKGPLSDVETIAVIGGMAAGASCFALTPGPLAETADAVSDLLFNIG